MLLVFPPAVRASNVVVLTEKPVAAFTLPDGTVLKNAYVWKRTSEGIMIIHDDGQYYLNFKTLPPDWRAAYEVLDSIEPVKSVAPQKYDQYSIFPLLDGIEPLSYMATAYYESDDYTGGNDGPMLMACAYQSLLDGNLDTAVRLNNLVKDHFPDTDPTLVESWYLSCKACYGKGVMFHICPSCGGSGECKRCGGTGEIKSQFSREDDEDKKKSKQKDDKDEDKNWGSKSLEHKESIRCGDCRGAGKCPSCRGKKQRSSKCIKCGGYGKILRTEEVEKLLKQEALILNSYYQKNGL